jgi:hypothetical protein
LTSLIIGRQPTDIYECTIVRRLFHVRSSFEPSARWFIDDDSQDVILRAERILHDNDEITISYGTKSNEELLYLYGFTLNNNHHDRVTIPVCLTVDDPLVNDKLQLIETLKLPARLTIDRHGQLTDQSKQLAHILSTTSLDRLDETNVFYTSYLLSLFDEYRQKLDLCSSDSTSITRYYLDSQKSIIEQAIEHMKSK